MNMKKLFSGKNLMILVVAALSLSACKKGGLFGKKKANHLLPAGTMMIKTWEIFMFLR